MTQDYQQSETVIVWINSMQRIGFVKSSGAHASDVIYMDLTSDGEAIQYSELFENEDLTYL